MLRIMSVLAKTTVKLLEAAPYRYDERSLRYFAGAPPTNDEFLIATEEALAYQTDYRVLRFLKKALLGGASIWAPAGVKQVIRYLASYVDADERTMWFPWGEFQIDADVYETQLGRYEIPFYYYTVLVGGESLNFLQMPVAHPQAEQDFQRMAGIILS